MKFWTGMFWSAALFNFAVGIGLGLFGEALYPQFGLDYAATDHIWRYMSAILIGMYGVGYALAAIDPSQNRNLIILGMFGKLFIVLLIGGLYMTGLATAQLAGTVAVDLVYVFLFFVFLYRTRTGAL